MSEMLQSRTRHFKAPAKVVVTGATGFVGRRLVAELVEQHCSVIGIDVNKSDSALREIENVQFVQCDLLTDKSTFESAIEGAEFVFHLAALTRSARPSDLVAINTASTQNVASACLAAHTAPTLVFISSLAACGPNQPGKPMVESDSCQPPSFYGKSKLACETLLRKNSGQLATSIIRSPIVLGPGDPAGLALFRMIKDWGLHLVPGRRDFDYSIVYVDDLVNAMLAVATNGKRISEKNSDQGVFFASTDEVYSYANLGKAIGKAIETDVRVIHVPELILKATGKLNGLISRLTGRSRFLNSDKLLEALGGNWVCSNDKIKAETGFECPFSFQDRLNQTVEWYRKNGWLKTR